jgi:hypothetical protein
MGGDMERRKLLILAIGLLLVWQGTGIPAYSFQYAKFLTTQDIEKVTGLKGVNPVPKNPDVDGDLNFAGPDGKVILSATFLPSTAYVGAKSSKEGFKSVVPGIGEEAFQGPAGASPSFILVFRKAAYTVMINTELEDQTRPRLPIGQLIAIGKLIASRM